MNKIVELEGKKYEIDIDKLIAAKLLIPVVKHKISNLYKIKNRGGTWGLAPVTTPPNEFGGF